MDEHPETHDCARAGRREADVVLATLTAKISNMHADMNEIKSSMKDLTQAVTKLALIEERQVQSAQEIGRVFKTLEKHDSRLAALEQIAANTSRTSAWVDRAVWAAATASVMYIAAKSGLIS